MMNMSDNNTAKPHRYTIPSKNELIFKIEDLLIEKISREEIASWAIEYVTYDNPQIYPEINDEIIFETIKNLSGADLTATDRPYLFGVEDFEEWLKELA